MTASQIQKHHSKLVMNPSQCQDVLLHHAMHLYVSWETALIHSAHVIVVDILATLELFKFVETT